jgi:hypothetical protein
MPTRVSRNSTQLRNASSGVAIGGPRVSSPAGTGSAAGRCCYHDGRCSSPRSADSTGSGSPRCCCYSSAPDCSSATTPAESRPTSSPPYPGSALGVYLGGAAVGGCRTGAMVSWIGAPCSPPAACPWPCSARLRLNPKPADTVASRSRESPTGQGRRGAPPPLIHRTPSAPGQRTVSDSTARPGTVNTESPRRKGHPEQQNTTVVSHSFQIPAMTSRRCVRAISGYPCGPKAVE